MVLLRLAFVSVVAIALPVFGEPGFKSKQEVPAELWEPASPSVPGAPVVSETLEFPEPRFEGVGSGEVRASMPGSTALRVETLPDMPFMEKVYDLSSDATAEVRWQEPVLTMSPGPVPLQAQPETLYWSNNPNFLLAKPAPGRFYPGKLVQTVQNGRQLRVRFFPLQWDRQTGEVVRLARVGFRIFQRTQDYRSAALPVSSNEGLILVRNALVDGARLLQTFHHARYGVASDIVTVESIGATEKEIAETELPDGYKDRTAGDEVVKPFDSSAGTGYDYSLARKISGYLQKRYAAGTGPKYVVLLGDARAIPPSYYFSTRSAFSVQFGVTDQCYAAVKQCLQPKAAVGRLPLGSAAEVTAYLSKVERWLSYAPTSRSELSLFGGKAFSGPFFTGELGVLRGLQTKADWRGVHKFFRTKGNYTKPTVLDMMKGNGDSSLVYSLDHGTGNEWYVESTPVASREVNVRTQGSTVNPLIFSIACTGGAYDEMLLQEDLFNDLGQGTESIGVALIRSAAGAVGYFGSSRPALGAPVYQVDSSGNLDLQDSNHGLKLLDTALEAYRAKGKGRLGDFVQGSLAAYAVDPASDVAKDRFRWTYLNAVLLADPAMVLPNRTTTESASPLAASVDSIQAVFSSLFPNFTLAADGTGALRVHAPSAVEATLFAQKSGSTAKETRVLQKTLPVGESDIAFEDPIGRQTFFLRLENVSGVPLERQVWFRTQ